MLSDDFTDLLDSSPLNINDTVSEWLRRWTRNPLGSARVGSNPTGVVFVFTFEKLNVVQQNLDFDVDEKINQVFICCMMVSITIVSLAKGTQKPHTLAASHQKTT